MNFEKLHALYHRPLLNLISQSREIHLEHWRGEEVQRCSLLSIKTGGCSEDIQFSLTVNNPFAEILYNVSGFKQHPGPGARMDWLVGENCSPRDEGDLRLASATDALQFLE
jgi:hypothetical protein